jgi:hypothetical protein
MIRLVNNSCYSPKSRGENQFCDFAISRLGDFDLSDLKSQNHQIAKSPNHKIPESQNPSQAALCIALFRFSDQLFTTLIEIAVITVPTVIAITYATL